MQHETKPLLKVACRDLFHAYDQIEIQELHLSLHFCAKQKERWDFKESAIIATRVLICMENAYHCRPNDGGIMLSETERDLVGIHLKTKSLAEDYVKVIEKLIPEFPVYNTFLKYIAGLSSEVAGVILSELDIHKAPNPSAFFVYSGLDIPPGKQEGRNRKSHAVTWNEFLKDKLMGVLAESLMDCCRPYAKFYHIYHKRILDREGAGSETWPEKRIHIASLRYMIKQFLVDLHYEWSIAEGLEPTKPYSEAVLGWVPESYARDEIVRG